MPTPFRFCRFVPIAVLAAVAFPTASGPAAGQPVEDFYRGKTLTMVIGYPPAGANDIYARLAARHLGRHIPGNPTIVPRNMPGAGSLIAANHLFNVAPRDGTVLGLMVPTLPLEEALGASAVKFRSAQFHWLGRMASAPNITVIMATSSVKTIADAFERTAILGATGRSATNAIYPTVLNNVLGTKFKVINGYKGANDVRLAMERGEVEGYAANPWNSLLSANPELVRERKLTMLVQIGLEREKDLPEVPLLQELAADSEQRAILDFISMAFAVGRPIATTPGVPPERLAALRKAFDDTLVDPVFIEAAAKVGAQIQPVHGEALQKLMDAVINAPPAIKDKVRAVMPPR